MEFGHVEVATLFEGEAAEAEVCERSEQRGGGCVRIVVVNVWCERLAGFNALRSLTLSFLLNLLTPQLQLPLLR